MPKSIPPVFPPRRPSAVIRYLIAVFLVCGLIYSFKIHAGSGFRVIETAPHSQTESQTSKHTESEDETPEKNSKVGAPGKASNVGAPPKSTGDHPIDKLIYDAQHSFAELVSKETNTLDEAAAAYRRRRGRHPPPGFDVWFEFAQNNSAIIVEDFFDQIYADLEPHWGLEPKVLRKESQDWEMTINVRDGNASTTSDWFWTVIWLDHIKTIEHMLPDMDLALNAMDEPRLVVPHNDITRYMDAASKTVKFPEVNKVHSQFQELPLPGLGDRFVRTREKKFNLKQDGRSYWDVARRGCAPDSLSQTTPVQKNFSHPPNINMTLAEPHMYKGFVSNYSLSTNLCHQPDLQGLSGSMIAPLSISATEVLFPMFGGSKLSINNEILLPAPMYLKNDDRFTGGNDRGPDWPLKENGAVWRGVATGGRNLPTNWRGFQRHRFAAMNNATNLELAEKGEHDPENFALPEEQYHIEAQEEGKLGAWVDKWSDVGITDLACSPSEKEGKCEYTGDFFSVVDKVSMAEQFSVKYLPDIDGNSFSGRYRGFLLSSSVPVKATLFREWHDSRLVPWKHFVPMDNRFGDWFGIMEYFLGYNGKGGHDEAGEKIANEGQEWAEQVLRMEDMQIYTLRLLLEYARLLDDDRENLGWVEDAIKDPSIAKTWL